MVDYVSERVSRTALHILWTNYLIGTSANDYHLWWTTGMDLRQRSTSEVRLVLCDVMDTISHLDLHVLPA